MQVRLTAERARELLAYDPETGVLTWKVTVGTKIKPGMQAATRPNKRGHLVMKLEGEQHYQHRLAWLIAHGKWPAGEIDHINQNPADNRLCNLRDVTHSDNLRNRRRSLVGISRVGDEWRAKVNGKHIGPFATREDAVAAYYRASIANNSACDRR